MSVAATVVVEFGTGADSSALVVIELDETMNLDGDGEEKTSFSPGDQPYFLVHHDTSVRIGSVKCSSGMVTGGNSVPRERSQQVQFAAAEEAQELSHIPSGGIGWTWYGNAPAITQTGKSLVAATEDSLPAIGEAKYTMEARQYHLIPPVITLADDETWPVLIVVYMEAA
ncbi:MAG: hypothetical protein JZU65_12775 [Chlorobium sp.]|jgi:hypothetical protein|nr:hypothetical protein [Chlorobium sp.]